jgi:D-serine dehydratase
VLGTRKGCVSASLTLTPTCCDPTALGTLVDAVPPHWKGAPLGAPVSLRTFAGSGVEALGGSLPLPLMLLRESAVAHNVARMARCVAEEGVLLAPHAKTTMSPELIARQIRAGCWAITAATPSHVDTLRRLRVQRILLANELVEPSAIHWLAREMTLDVGFELVCLVDSIDGVALLDRELRAARAPRPVAVLIEVGTPGGRAGVRTIAQARTVAVATNAAPALELAGIECFEGLAMDPARIPETLAAVKAQLDAVHAIAVDLRSAGLLAECLLSAGGSAFFDHVLARFPRPDWRVVLRSGCYVSQDGGFYDKASPLAGRGHDPDPLRDALELWGVVLSRPQAGIAVVGAGKRDAPFDVSPPQPVAWRSADGRHGDDLVGATVVRLNDQHATISLLDDDRPAVGDLVRFTVSHPCGAFDRWRVIPLVDDDRRVIDAVHTAF